MIRLLVLCRDFRPRGIDDEDLIDTYIYFWSIGQLGYEDEDIDLKLLIF